MVDSSSAKLLAQINQNRSKLSVAPVVLVVGIIAAFALYPRINPPWTGLATIVGYLLGRAWDVHRKTTVLMYDFEDSASALFAVFHDAFGQLSRVGRLWHVNAAGAVRSRDRKYQAGATALLGRKQIAVAFAEPKFVRTNIPVAQIPVGRQTLYFLPDAVLVVEGSKTGAISYSTLDIRTEETNFIEADGVPVDSKVIGSTWRYVNKSGGPDRRFKNNRQLPIVRYEQLRLQSRTGLNELIQVSRVGAGAKFADGLKSLARIDESSGAISDQPPIIPSRGEDEVSELTAQTAETARQSMINLLELVDQVCVGFTSSEKRRLADEAQEVLLGLMAAVLAEDGRFDLEEQAFFRELVDVGTVPGAEVAVLRSYAERWRVTPPKVPDFLRAALEYDVKHSTTVVRAILSEIQLVGNNAAASDRKLQVGEINLVRQYLAYLEHQLES